jgi:hypothetical protein
MIGSYRKNEPSLKKRLRLAAYVGHSLILPAMHSLEQEYIELKAAGLIDEAAALRAVAIDNGSIFSLFAELRFALYAAVLAITTGIGILLKNNLDRIGPVTLVVTLALIAAICYATALRTKLRREARSLGGDYVLLLGALILSADLAYVETQFHWLGADWSWHLLILAALHAVTAYMFNSRLVLSVALTSLAGWFGIHAQLGIDVLFDNSLRHTGTQALVCAAVIMAWREVHRRASSLQSFIEVLEHFAAHTGFWGALALSFDDATLLIGVLLVIGLAVVSIRKGLQDRQEAFVVYGVVYGALGLCIFEAGIVGEPLFIVLLVLITIVVAMALLWRFHAQLKERTV